MMIKLSQIKHCLWLILASQSSWSCSAQINAQRYQIKTNLPNLLVVMWNIQYQKQLREDKALQFSWATIDHDVSGRTHAKGNVLTLDFKSYFQKNKRKSVRYVAPFIRYEGFVFEGGQDRVRARHPGCGVMAGKEIIFLRRMVLDLHLGLNYFPDRLKVLQTDGYLNVEIPASLHGLGPRAGLCLGYSF